MLLAILLPLSLIISPGQYEKNKVEYECHEEGLYRFGKYPDKTEQRIVYDDDLFRLLQSITWIHLHGLKDTNLSDQKKLEQAKIRKISIACGDIARFTKTILDLVKIQSRVVQFLTLDAYNGYNDGHLMIEVLDENRWILVDIDMRNMFIYDDQILSASELIAIGIDNVQIFKFSEAPLLAYSELYSDAYKYDFSLGDEEAFIRKDMRPFYKRVCQKFYYSNP